MFHLKNKIKNARKEYKKKNYDLTYDNVAIPEVHKTAATAAFHPEGSTAPAPEHPDSSEHASSVNFDNVAIPEIHIRKKS